MILDEVPPTLVLARDILWILESVVVCCCCYVVGFFVVVVVGLPHFLASISFVVFSFSCVVLAVLRRRQHS